MAQENVTRYRGLLTNLDGCDPDALVQDMRGPESVKCLVCHRLPAVACDECRRALTLFAEQPMPTRPGEPVPFDCISRHPESGTDCNLCLRGRADLCGTCLLEGALQHRTLIRGEELADK